MQHRTFRRATNHTRHITHRCDAADFVVHGHHRHNGNPLTARCNVVQRKLQLVHVDDPVLIDRNNHATQMFHTVQHGMVLGCTANCNSPMTAHGPKDCGIVALGATAREHHFTWRTTQHFGDVISCLVNRCARRPRKPVTSRRVGKLIR